ncbi:hypothetical protein D3C80_1088110 [compost metagenome]
MLQADTAQLVRYGHEEVVVVIVAGAEQAVGLGHQVAVQLDMLVGGFQHLGRVGDDVEADGRAAARIQVDLAIVLAGEDRAVGQVVESDGGEGRQAVLEADGVEAGAVVPAGGQFQGRLEGDLTRVVAGGIEQGLLPLDVQHLGRDDDAALIALDRGQPLEGGLDLGHARRNLNLIGPGLDCVAHPLQPPALGGEGQAADVGDRADRAVVARNPLRIEEDQRAGAADRDGLAHLDQAPVDVRGVDMQLDDARIGFVLGGRNRRQGDGQGGRADLGQGGRPHGKEDDRGAGGQEETLHDGYLRTAAPMRPRQGAADDSLSQAPSSRMTIPCRRRGATRFHPAHPGGRRDPVLWLQALRPGDKPQC